MQDHLKKTLELLKAHVQQNLQKIHENEKKVREILQDPVSQRRSDLLTEKYSVNKSMLEENNDFIKMQLSIIQFMDKYRNKIKSNESLADSIQNNNEPLDDIEYSKEDILFLTANGNMPFDNNHPYFEDQEFIDELFDHLLGMEEYEMCEKIKNTKGEIN